VELQFVIIALSVSLGASFTLFPPLFSSPFLFEYLPSAYLFSTQL